MQLDIRPACEDCGALGPPFTVSTVFEDAGLRVAARERALQCESGSPVRFSLDVRWLVAVNPADFLAADIALVTHPSARLSLVCPACQRERKR